MTIGIHPSAFGVSSHEVRFEQSRLVSSIDSYACVYDRYSYFGNALVN